MAKTKEYLVKAQVIKNVANKIIDFLAQIEDFQKKMYLKKKLVVSTNYCITLDRIPEKMYQEIIQNDDQRKEWVKLFAIDGIKAENIQSLFDQQKVGYTEPLTIEFLKQNPYLVLDTKFFSDDFKERLVESIDDLDENTNGLLVSSENFQFLNLVQKRYVQEFDTIYIDPPYNTDASEILYKNNYKDSSWMTLIANRLQISRNLLKPNGISITTIDEWELKELYGLLEEEFGKNLNAGIIAIRINPSGRPRDGGLALAHEYALFFRNSYLAVIGKFGRSDEQMSRYNKSDERGPFEQRNFRREGSNSDRFDGIRQWYPFFVNQSNLSLRIPKIKWNDAKKDYDILEKPSESEIIIYPITDEGVEKNWRWAWENVVKDYSQFYAIKQKSGFQIYYKFRPNNEGISPLTFWDDKKYSATEQGTKMLKNMLPENTFAYPKSLYAVEDCIKIANGWKKDALVLDYFAGSGTTAHSVIELNRADNGTRKYVLCEMGEYFNTITKPRVEKAIYSKEWKQGKPIARDGISQCFKYLKLESYEDSLNNIKFNNSLEQIPDGLKEEYLLKYMIDMETKESMFNVDKLAHPFNYVMDITQKQETKKTVMDIVESFNYLIGLVVERSYAKKSYDATFTNGEYGVLEAQVSDGTAYTLKLIEGHSLSGDKILVIWRDMTDDIAKDNAVLDAVLAKKVITIDEFDRIYVNGDNNLNNTNGNKVFLIEDEMRKRMFED